MASPQAERLAHARGLLRRATQGLESAGKKRPRPSAVTDETVLPVAPPLRALFPDHGLRRGTVVQVGTSTSLLLALLAEASRQGTWCAVIGRPNLGLVAAQEAGLDLNRVALIPRPGTELLAVVSAVLDGISLVVASGTRGLRAGDRQRLAAMARQRGGVLVVTDHWPGADMTIDLEERLGEWRGLSTDGHGRLQSRRVRIRATGRGMAPRGQTTTALLPGPQGALCDAEQATAFRGAVTATGLNESQVAHAAAG